MNKTLMDALIQACQKQDDIRIVTCALQIAAAAARENRLEAATAIRHLVNEYHRRDSVDTAYLDQRRQMVTQLFSGMLSNPFSLEAKDAIQTCIAYADAIMLENNSAPVPQITQPKKGPP